MSSSPIKVTFIIKNLTTETVQALEDMIPGEAFALLSKWAFGDLRHCVKVKYGSANAFRDRVEVNSAVKAGKIPGFKLEPRRGYQLATFVF